jgi:ribonuclease HII
MILPNFNFEKKLRRQGYRLIAGVDEVGRGCFAGSVVAGAVVFRHGGVLSLGSPTALPPANKHGAPSVVPPASRHPSIVINDSKKLSAKRREAADKWIRKNAVAFGIGTASVSQINKLGIKKATEIAFRKAIKNCEVQIDYLLIDAFYIPYVRGLRRKNQKAIIKGDTKSISIAAASIIAKVYRDKLMTDLSRKLKYKKYKWNKNKGYGTKEHQKMIRKYGISDLHRTTYVATWLSKT